MTKEIIVPAKELADYHWKNIKAQNPEKFERMQKDMSAYGDRISFGFNERLEPVSCYVAI